MSKDFCIYGPDDEDGDDYEGPSMEELREDVRDMMYPDGGEEDDCRDTDD